MNGRLADAADRVDRVLERLDAGLEAFAAADIPLFSAVAVLGWMHFMTTVWASPGWGLIVGAVVLLVAAIATGRGEVE